MVETLYIVMPVYNEEANLRDVVADWYPILEAMDPASRMLLIDDGSSDASAALLEELAQARPQLEVISRENRGHGATLRELYTRAIEAGAEWVLQTDSDGQTLPSEFGAFWLRRSGQDLLIGCRPEREDGRWRRFVSRVLGWTLQLVLGVHLVDANTPYRLMRAQALARWLEGVPEDAKLTNALIAAAADYVGSPTTWLEISFRQRQGGVNSIDLGAIVRHGWRAVGEFRRARSQFRAVFGPRRRRARR